MISHLYTRPQTQQGLRRKLTNTSQFTLHHFHGLFNDDIPPIICS